MELAEWARIFREFKERELKRVYPIDILYIDPVTFAAYENVLQSPMRRYEEA